MHYLFATERPDYSDLASGRVLYSLPGHPAFPIRLADEILQRCLAWRAANHLTGSCVLYDPCCGGAYHLSVLAALHWRSFREIVGSDIDESAVGVARRNLGLLSADGLDRRVGELSDLFNLYGKESHNAALESARRLRARIGGLAAEHPLGARVFQANALDGEALRQHLNGVAVEIVFADVPYGWQSQWRASDPGAEPGQELLVHSGNGSKITSSAAKGSDPFPECGRAPNLHDAQANSDAQSGDPLRRMLDALLAVTAPTSVVAVISDKQQKARHEGYQRLEQFQVGKRRVVLLKPEMVRR